MAGKADVHQALTFTCIHLADAFTQSEFQERASQSALYRHNRQEFFSKNNNKFLSKINILYKAGLPKLSDHNREPPFLISQHNVNRSFTL